MRDYVPVIWGGGGKAVTVECFIYLYICLLFYRYTDLITCFCNYFCQIFFRSICIWRLWLVLGTLCCVFFLYLVWMAAWPPLSTPWKKTTFYLGVNWRCGELHWFIISITTTTTTTTYLRLYLWFKDKGSNAKGHFKIIHSIICFLSLSLSASVQMERLPVHSIPPGIVMWGH